LRNQLCADYLTGITLINNSTVLDLDLIIEALPRTAFETYKQRHDGELDARYQLYLEDAWW
jgi:hypothetical protein